MGRTENQKLKLLYLKELFERQSDEEHLLSMQDILDALAAQGIRAERKSVYDDILCLQQFGMDIVTVKGRNGGYFLASRTFELPELKLLVDAVQSSKFITHKKSNELIKKIEGFTSCYEARRLHRQVFVTNRIKTMNESIYYTVDYIHEAINSNAKVSFRYFNWNERKQKVMRHDGKKYIVSPWALTWDDENYYMIGYDSESGLVKHYRVDKMTDIGLIDEERDGAEHFKNFDMAIYSKKTFGMYGGDEETVTLRCKNELAGVIIDRFGFDTPFVNVTDTHFEVHVKVQASPLFFTWVMNFGSDMTIISPEIARENFIKLAKKALAQYE